MSPVPGFMTFFLLGRRVVERKRGGRLREAIFREKKSRFVVERMGQR